MSEIDDVFNSLIKETEDLINNIGQTFLHQATIDVTEAWANEIIDMLLTRNISPPLSEKTIKRRTSRQESILGPDYPLLETGEWITYIEFRLTQHKTYDTLEVGVFDESTKIGHSGSVTPAYVAKVNEYGNDELIPSRALFATSELTMDSTIDVIIKDAWDKIQSTTITASTVVPIKSRTGRIVISGSDFEFRWDT